MELKKYERWPIAFIDEEGKIWRRSKTKGWFEIRWGNPKDGKGHGSTSTHMNHPSLRFFAKKIMTKKELAEIETTRAFLSCIV
jgi:hypothetical protein